MERIKTKILTLFLMALVSLYPISVSANSTAIINTPDLNTQKVNEDQYVVLKIEDNPGIMGFRLHFDYDENRIAITSVNRGDVTSVGGFNNNIGLKNNCFDLVWSNTADVKNDGSIAILKVRLLTNEPTVINVSYSQDDTFNEAWENVDLICQPIVTDNYVADNGDKDSESVDLTDQDLKDNQTGFIISDILDLMDISSLNDIDNDKKNEVLNEVNKQIVEIYEVSDYFQTFDELKDEYTKDLIKNMIEDIESLQTDKTPKECIDDALSSKQEDDISIESVPIIMDYLEKEGLDTIYQDRLSNSELQNALNSIYQENDKALETSVPESTHELLDDEKDTKSTIRNPVILCLIVGGVVLLISVVSMILYKNLKKRKAD